MRTVDYVAPFVGAISLESVHWYQLREHLHLAKYQRLLRSKAYWLITLAMVLLGGAGSLILFEDRLRPGELFVAGAAFPTLLKKLVAGFSKERVTLGDDTEGRRATAGAMDYFKVS